MTNWAEVHCKVCDKSFAVNWDYLEEDGCFVKAGKEEPLFCPYCRAEALFAGESVDEDWDPEEWSDDEAEEEDCEDTCCYPYGCEKGPVEEYP